MEQPFVTGNTTEESSESEWEELDELLAEARRFGNTWMHWDGIEDRLHHRVRRYTRQLGHPMTYGRSYDAVLRRSIKAKALHKWTANVRDVYVMKALEVQRDVAACGVPRWPKHPVWRDDR